MNGEVKGNIPLLTGSRAFSLGFQPLQVSAIVPCSALESYTLHGAAGNNGRRFLKLDKRSVDETQPPRFYLRLKA